MAILFNLEKKEKITDPQMIKQFMNERGIIFEQWDASFKLNDHDSQEVILKAYEHKLKPYMEKHGYQDADVVNVHKETPNIEEIRAKFLSEHTHSEDEIRFFVDGEGLFYFHLENSQPKIFSLLCQKGDFISVPKGAKHWFDLAPKYFVKAIRVFSNKEGWTPHYTGSKIEQNFLNL